MQPSAVVPDSQGCTDVCCLWGAGFNYATWESAVMGFASAGNLRQLRRSMRKQDSAVTLKPAGPKLLSPPGLSYDERVGSWVVPFPGIPSPPSPSQLAP